jgi:hypothetical protein
MENKKIVNATPITLNEITFKSKLEGKLFKVLQDEGLNPKYEPFKFHVWQGFKPSVPFYERNKKTRSIALNDVKIIDITYTPDIVFDYKRYRVFVEVKPDGFTNDVYPYKQKLFRKYMETEITDLNPIFVRVGTIKNLREFIKILRENYNEES